MQPAAPDTGDLKSKVSDRIGDARQLLVIAAKSPNPKTVRNLLARVDELLASAFEDTT